MSQKRSTASSRKLNSEEKSSPNVDMEEDVDYDEDTEERGMKGPVPVTSTENLLVEMLSKLQVSVGEIAEEMTSLRDKVKTLENSQTRAPAPEKSTSFKTPERRTFGRISMLETMNAKSARKPWEGRQYFADHLYNDETEDNEEEEDSYDYASARASTGGNTVGRSDSKSNRLFKDIQDSQSAATKNVMVIRKEKECNVKIRSLTLSQVSGAIKRIIDFQEEEGLKVNFLKVITPDIKRHLQVRHHIDSAHLVKMSIDELFDLVAMETRVFSKTAFYNELKLGMKHITVSDWNKVVPETHEAFYLQQLKLMDEFQRLLKIMLIHNKNVCPDVNFKEGGLLRLFKDANDPTYFSHIRKNLSKQDFKSVKEFMDEYQQIISDEFQLSYLVREVPYHCFQSKDAQKENTYFKKRRELNDEKPSYGYAKRSTSTTEDLMHVDTTDSSENDEKETVWKTSDSDREQVEPDSDTSNDEMQADEEGDSLEDPDLLYHCLAFADQGKQSNDKKSFACLKKLLSGTCGNDVCPYSHKPDVLTKGAREMKDKLSVYLATTSARPPDNSRRPGYTAIQSKKYTNKSTEADDNELHHLLLNEDVMDDAFYAEYNTSKGINNIYFNAEQVTQHSNDSFRFQDLTAAHSKATVILGSDSENVLVKVLCDTGALSANYISTATYERLKPMLN